MAAADNDVNEAGPVSGTCSGRLRRRETVAEPPSTLARGGDWGSNERSGENNERIGGILRGPVCHVKHWARCPLYIDPVLSAV